MKTIRGRIYIRKLEIVDDNDNIIYKVSDVPLKQGMQGALEVIQHKDSEKTVAKIFSKFVKYIDEDFKNLFGMEEENDKKNK